MSACKIRYKPTLKEKVIVIQHGWFRIGWVTSLSNNGFVAVEFEKEDTNHGEWFGGRDIRKFCLEEIENYIEA